MARVAVFEAGVYEGALYEVVWEDGLGVACDYSVVATLAGGRQVVHEKAFQHRSDAVALADAVAARGSVDLAYWSEFVDPREYYRELTYGPDAYELERQEAAEFEAWGQSVSRRYEAPLD